MSVRKQPDGSWRADFRIDGEHSKRWRKSFATKGEAEAWKNYILRQSQQKPWLGEKADRRTLADLIERWHELHGKSLADPDRRLNKLKIICEGMGNPVASLITVNDWAKYREQRLAGQIADTNGRRQTVKPNTVNHEHAYLCALFNELKRLGEWPLPNPLDGVRKFRTHETELAFLYSEEIPKLLDACATSGNPDLVTVTKICLATGARWSEAEGLTASQVGVNRLTFTKTKGKKNRTVPISPELAAELPRKRGRLFSDCRKAFERAVKRADFEFPDGQMTHILRHTFASHFMMNGGNILVLQQILGHANIKETMRYAHFAPDHLDDAVTKNPLANLVSTHTSENVQIVSSEPPSCHQ